MSQLLQQRLRTEAEWRGHIRKCGGQSEEAPTERPEIGGRSEHAGVRRFRHIGQSGKVVMLNEARVKKVSKAGVER